MHAVVLAIGLALGSGLAPPPPGEPQPIRVAAHAPDEVGVPPPVVDHLAAGDVLRIQVTGGVEDAEATVAQCRRTPDGLAGCRNRFPVRFGPAGTATFQYQLVDPGGCGADDGCVVVVRDLDETSVAIVWTVFADGAPAPPTVSLVPPGPYARGSDVRVGLSAGAPATRYTLAVCDPDCERAAQLTTDGTGSGTARVRIPDRCAACRIVVLGPATSVSVPFSLSAPAGPDYRLPRLVGGLLAALVLLAAAWNLIASTDWRPPSEAATGDDVPDGASPRRV